MSDWDLRKLYEQPPPDLMEAEAFFSAFSKLHDIDGKSLDCIFTKAKRQPITLKNAAERSGIDGLSTFSCVLIARSEDVPSAQQGATLRIDGTYCQILTVTHPISGVTRLDLEGYSG